MLKSLRSWLGVEAASAPEQTPLREVLDALDHLEPGRAKHLARFAYLLGRVAHADDKVSPEETHVMESLLVEHGQLTADQAMLVVGLAKSSNLLFGGTADFLVAREFGETTTYEERLALARCLFAVAATDARISVTEEAEVHQITNQLHIEAPDLTAIRLQHRRILPGMSPRQTAQ
jgi:uncharacterized tellurite resistance protein B-like protein